MTVPECLGPLPLLGSLRQDYLARSCIIYSDSVPSWCATTRSWRLNGRLLSSFFATMWLDLLVVKFTTFFIWRVVRSKILQFSAPGFESPSFVSTATVRRNFVFNSHNIRGAYKNVRSSHTCSCPRLLWIARLPHITVSSFFDKLIIPILVFKCLSVRQWWRQSKTAVADLSPEHSDTHSIKQ